MIMVVLGSCSSGPNFKPRKVNYDRDVCAQCLMGIADQHYAVQVINSEGDVRWFDDIGCLFVYMKSPDWQKFVKSGAYKIWIGDSQGSSDNEWIDAHKAFYTFGKNTPMGYGYSAEKKATDSSFTFLQVQKRIVEGKTIREKFLEKYKLKRKN